MVINIGKAVGGVYDYVKREMVGANGRSPVRKIVRRRYVCGGLLLTTVDPVSQALDTLPVPRQNIFRRRGIAVCLNQSPLAIHHPGARALPQRANHFSGYVHKKS